MVLLSHVSLADEPLNKAVRWLVDQQDDSGAWKSQTYGSMKQGAATTALSLYAMSHLSKELRDAHSEAIEKAIAFLQPGIELRNRTANPEGSLDHPVYGTAMYLIAMHRIDADLESKQLQGLLRYLIDSQCVEPRGFQAEDPNYGGWDIIGPNVVAGKTSGTNVSITRFAVDALQRFSTKESQTKYDLPESLVTETQKSIAVAGKWVKKLHAKSRDGGFIFSPHPGTALNKSKANGNRPLPYGSATSDGLLILKMANGAEGAQFRQASGWLKENSNFPLVPGFESEDFDSGWSRSLRFYYYQAFSSAVSQIDDEKWSVNFTSQLASTIRELQQPDGHFANDSALMREDDPLIATSFAIIALANCSRIEAQAERASQE